MQRQTLTILSLTLAGFALRLYYAVATHPFFDEYTTVLAARQILRHGWPLLPSGLFYEHGLLATYVIAPFTALYINTSVAGWQPAQWGLMLSRWPSVMIGTATIPLIFAAGRRYLGQPAPALLAAGLFALSPEGMVWGGRARMYALATLLVLLTTMLAYRGAVWPAPARYRWAALLALLAALLTQLGVLTVVPPLLAAMVITGWHSRPNATGKQAAPKIWFFRRAVLPEAGALGLVIGLAVWVKRLGQPLGAALLSEAENGLGAELVNTVAYQTAFHFTWADTVKFLARQFGVPHHFWLSAAALAGLAVVLLGGTAARFKTPAARFPLFLALTFGLIMVEMVTLLEPFRRNPRYLVMYLPLFYLLAAWAIFSLARAARLPRRFHPLAAIALLALFTALGWADLRVALLTPEPAYEAAFAWLNAQRQPGEALLTMNTPAAALYAGGVDGFTVQENASQFLLMNPDTAPVDRWLGAPWLGTAADFNAALNQSATAWFIIDTIRQPVYFRGDWLAVVNTRMEPVWAADDAIIYRTRPNRTPISTAPATLVNATLGSTIRLTGYSLAPANPAPDSTLHLTLFWQPLAAPEADYTVFVHLRAGNGETVAQRDAQPLNGLYPTTRWQPGETVIDPIRLDVPPNLPPGPYRLLAGLYRLNTLARLPVTNDTTGENAVLLGEVTLP
jgi:hypothetical protein